MRNRRITATASGSIFGVLEIYRDVSDDVVVQVDDLKATVLRTTVLTMGGLFLVLSVFVAAADASRHRSNQGALARERQLRERVDENNRALHRANEAKGRFLSTVSHELKTPLTSMLAFTELMLDNPYREPTPQQEQQLRVIDRNGYRLNLLINDILDLSRIDAGTIKIEPTNFAARDLLEELVDSLIPLYDKRRQTLRALMPPDELWVNADRDRIAQVVSNLLSNASKYSPEGSTVQLTARGEGNRLWVTVRDYGIGISEEDQKDLFSAFFRADNLATRAAPGTGLGLVIAKSLVEMHGGEISIESQVGEGTSVTFYVHGLLPGPPDERGQSRLEAVIEPGSRLDEPTGDTALAGLTRRLRFGRNNANLRSRPPKLGSAGC